MKIFLKVVKIAALSIGIALGVLLVAGWIMQDRITKYALDELSETFESPLATEKVTFSLIKDFPMGSLKFEKLWIGSYRWNENNEIQSIDTLAKVNSLFISVDTKDLLNNIFTIRKVELQNGYVKYNIDENGISNYDFLLSSDTTVVKEESEPLDLTAEDIILNNLTLIYQDDQQKARAKVLLSQIEGSTILKDPRTYAQVKGKVQLSDIYVQDTPLDRLQQADLSIDLIFRTDTLNVESLTLETDELSLSTRGRLILGDQMYTELSTSVQSSDLAALTKYAPDDLLNTYEIGQISGALKLTSKINGFVADGQLPHYELSADLSKGSLRWQNYPPIHNIALQVDVTNGQSNSNTTTSIQLKKLMANFSGNQIDMSGNFSNLDQINYDLTSRIDIDLEASSPIVPDSLVKKLGGKMQVQVTTKGILPDSVNSEFVDAALKNTTAKIILDQMEVIADNQVHINELSGQLIYMDHKVNIENVNVNLPDYKLRMTNNNLELELQGDLMKTESIVLNIPSFHLSGKEGSIHGSASIKRLEDVSFSMKSNLNLALNDLKRFAPDTLVNDMKGEISAVFQSSGRINLNNIESGVESAMYDQSSLDLTLKNIHLDMKDTLLNVSNLSGHVTKKNHQVAITNLGGSYQGIDFMIETTTIDNLFNTALRNQEGLLEVNGVYRLGDLDYSVLGAFASNEEPDQKSKSTSPPPAWNYDIKGKLSAKSFKYDDSMIRDLETSFDIQGANEQIIGDLTASNITYDNTLVSGLSSRYLINTSTNEIKGKLAIKDIYYEDAILNSISALYNIKDSIYTIDQLKFNAFGGKLNASAKITIHENEEIEIEMKNDIDHINMRRLMQEMKDFGESEITHKNFSGELTSDNLFLRMKLLGDSVIYDDLRMTADLKFENGGIFHYPPVQSMAEYLPKVDNLDTMKFKTINTHMFLFKDAVYVPSTYVVTSVFDVEAIGQQGFGEDFQYHVGVNIAQVLSKNKKFNLEDDGPVKKKKMIRRLVTGRDGAYTNENSNGGKRDETRTKIKVQEKILEFRFQPQRFNFDTGAEKL